MKTDAKPVMGEQTPRTAKAVDDAWRSLPTSDHRLGYMISFSQGLELEMAALKHDMERGMANHNADLNAPCGTCNDDPKVCATVPGLRHCEGAMRGAFTVPEGAFRMPRMMDYAEGLSPEAKAEFILELRETAAFYSSQRSAKCYQDPRTDSLEPQGDAG